jgi:hypothetical protein
VGGGGEENFWYVVGGEHDLIDVSFQVWVEGYDSFLV